MKAARARATTKLRKSGKIPACFRPSIDRRAYPKKAPKKSGNSHLNRARLQKNIGF